MADVNDDPKIKELLTQYSDRRKRIDGYIDNMEGLMNQVNKLFPTTIDYKSKFVLEEKIKASSSFYSTLLSLTQEYNKSIVQEIEILRKLATSGDTAQRDIKEIIEALELQHPNVVNQLTDMNPRSWEQITQNDIEQATQIEILTHEELLDHE